MARYPTFDEYAKKGNFLEGIKRCDELLQRNPKDVQILITKLQLTCAAGGHKDPILEQLLALQPPIADLRDLVPIEDAVVDAYSDVYPPISTAGPNMSKLWDNAMKMSNSADFKIDLLSVRLSRAVMDDRIQDAQQTLIAWKAFQPKTRWVYMAHLAYTQMLSQSREDLQSRLALSLARKAVNDKFDEDPALDCRVSGQIFATQGSEKDLESIKDRPAFRESKLVYQALKLGAMDTTTEPAAATNTTDAKATSSREWLTAEVESLKQVFSELVSSNAPTDTMKEFTANAIRLFHTATMSLELHGRDRGAAEACFLAVSGLVKLFADDQKEDADYLFHAAYLTERLLKFNEHIHEARLILVYLYMRLGLGGLAMQYFDSLSVKEIQNDTVGHTLFTQLSLLHPFKIMVPVNDMFESEFEPHERTHKALTVYHKHEHRLSECEASVLNHMQTGMVFDLNELRVQLRDSFSRRMLLLEHRRISRLTGKLPTKDSGDIGPRVLANWLHTKDNRDFKAAFDYGFNVEAALYCGTDEFTLTLDLATDTAWALASKQPSLVKDIETLIGKLLSSTTPKPKPIHHLTTQRTAAILTLLNNPSSCTTETVQALKDSVATLDTESLLQSTDPLADTLKDHYSHIDTLRIIMRTCKFLLLQSSPADKTPADASGAQFPEDVVQAIQDLQDTARQHVVSLQQHANKQSRAIQASSVFDRLLKDDTLRKPMQKFGEGDLRTFAKNIVASAREGWGDVTKVSVPS